MIGAGIGGLTVALLLAARGLDVVVCERAAAPGGKMRLLDVGRVAIDAGPTVFTMKWVFDEIFDEAGLTFDDAVGLRRLRTIARHAWNEHERLDLFADVRESADAIGAFAGAGAARGFLDFTRAAADAYGALRDTFLRASLPTMPGLVARMGVSGLRQFMQASPMKTMWSELGRYMPDPRLRQLFGRYATYVGSSPFEAPATLMLIAHVEQQGVWSVDGGMHGLARALAQAVERKGARIRYETHVDRVHVSGRRASGVVLKSGERVDADAVVFNGDVGALTAGMLGADAVSAVSRPTGARSLSAVTWLLRAQTDGFPLVRHAVFFSRDYQAEFKALMSACTLPADPTVYVCAQDRADDDDAPPAGPERLFCLINAPAAEPEAGPKTHHWTAEEIEGCRHMISRRLAACGLTLTPSGDSTEIVTPPHFERLFPGSAGALYGRVTHGAMASFQRPGSRTRIRGLYLAGGSVHPGAGVPMAALSGRLAARSVLQDLTSRVKFHPAAMPGGISTG